MSSPRGLDAGGIGGIGTEELRFVLPAFGEGERRRVGTTGAEGAGVGRGNSKVNGFKNEGSFERRGGWRTLRYILKFRSARLACGT